MNRAVFLCVLILSGCTSINNSRTFKFIYKVEIESTNGKKLEMWLPVPQSNEVQIISDLYINTNNLNFSIEDEKLHNNKYLYINHLSGTTKTTIITMMFNVLRKEHQNINYENVSPHKYLGAYYTVPVGGIFKKIIAENKLSRKNVRRIYDYVLEGMHYGKPKSIDNKYYKEPWLSEDAKYGMKQVGRDNVVDLYNKSKAEGGNYTFGKGNALYACDIGVGNCTDYHSYFMSLSRTMGIPTRFHMGFPISSDDSGEVVGYHCWADYYVKGKGWYPVDISEADNTPDNKDYFFGAVDQNRIEFMVGRDFILKGYEPEITNFFIYPLVEVDDETSVAFKKYVSYKNL